MLKVTNAALDRLSRRLRREKAAEGTALRFTRREGGWKLRLDRESAGDTAFSHDGRKVLLLDADVAKAMANMSLDTKQDGQRSGLRLQRKDRRED